MQARRRSSGSKGVSAALPGKGAPASGKAPPPADFLATGGLDASILVWELPAESAAQNAYAVGGPRVLLACGLCQPR